MPKNIGKRIREAREQANFTQGQLAVKLGVSFQAIQRLEHGEFASLKHVEVLAAVLNMDYDWLLTGHERAPNIITPIVAAKMIPAIGFYSRQPQISPALVADEQVKHMFGLLPDAAFYLTLDDWLKSVHKDDLTRIEGKLARCDNPRGNGIFWAEYILVGRDGVERRIMDLSRTTFDKAKRVILRIGWMLDISHNKRTDNEHKRAVNVLREALAIYERNRHSRF